MCFSSSLTSFVGVFLFNGNENEANVRLKYMEHVKDFIESFKYFTFYLYLFSRCFFQRSLTRRSLCTWVRRQCGAIISNHPLPHFPLSKHRCCCCRCLLVFQVTCKHIYVPSTNRSRNILIIFGREIEHTENAFWFCERGITTAITTK